MSAIRIACAGLLLACLAPDIRADDAVVGNGTAGSCTDAAINGALGQLYPGANFPGGTLSFNCGPNPVSIPITTPKGIGFGTGTAVDGGGRVTLDAGNVTRHFVVSGNESRVEIRDIVLINGNAGAGNGGSVFLGSGAFLLLQRVLLRDNVAGGAGGAVITETGSALALDDVDVLSNDAANGGGIAANGSLTLQDSLIALNDATGEGGGVQSYFNTALIERTRFENNGALDGGGLLQRGGTLTVRNATFTDNSVSRRGGGAYVYGNAPATIDDSVFERNIALQGGGLASAAEAQGPDVDTVVNRGRFEGNRADDGGALYVDGTLFTQTQVALRVRGTALIANTARRGGAGFSDGILDVKDAEARDNEAEQGGAYFAMIATVIVDGGSVVGNIATQQGGGIASVSGFLTVRGGATFRENRATDGGAWWGLTTLATVQDTTMVGNIASRHGGGFHLLADGGFPGTLFVVANLTTSGNQALAADSRGGDVYLRGNVANTGGTAQMNIAGNATLIDGAAFSGSTLFADASSTINIGGSVIWPLLGFSCGSAGNGVITSTGGNVGPPTSCVLNQAGDTTVASFAALGLAPLADNGGTAPTFLPQPGSVVLDRAGCGSPRDARGLARPVDGNGDGSAVCDAGAVERQLSEQPGGPALFRDGFED